MADSKKQLMLPARRTVQLPRPELSAREALEWVLPAISEMGSDWFLSGIATAGFLGLDGCLAPSPNSSWQFNLCRSGRQEFVTGLLFSEGTLSFRKSIMSPASRPRRIDGDWLDSRAIAEIVTAEPDLSDLREHETLWMGLRTLDDGVLFWEVHRDSHQVASRQRARTTFCIHAQTGEILAESYERWDESTKIKTLPRKRWQGSDWEEAEPGSPDDKPVPDAETFH